MGYFFAPGDKVYLSYLSVGDGLNVPGLPCPVNLNGNLIVADQKIGTTKKRPERRLFACCLADTQSVFRITHVVSQYTHKWLNHGTFRHTVVSYCII